MSDFMPEKQIFKKIFDKINIFCREKILITGEEVKFLKENAGDGGIIVEVGSYKGKSTLALAERNLVVSIDPFLPVTYNPEDLTYTDDMETVRKCFLKNIRGKNVVSLRQKSEDALKEWHQEINGVFIDGEHSYNALQVDNEWIDFVKKGGFIAFHDYSEGWKEVKDFVDKNIKPKYKLIGIEGSLIIFKK